MATELIRASGAARPPIGARAVRAALAIAAMSAAAAGARPYASGWNDGSRLATVEALVDRSTFAIDDSIFVNPALVDPAGGTPYASAGQPGTLDKLFIGNHFYSDKSPVPALPMAALYAALQRATGLVARRDAAAFSFWMSVLTSGVSYAFAVAGMFTLAFAVFRSTEGPARHEQVTAFHGGLRVPSPLRDEPSTLKGATRHAAIVTASFGVSTTALAYACAVNNHIMLLALATWVMVSWHGILSAEPVAPQGGRVLWLGLLSGAAYSVDLAVGPILAFATAAVVAWTCRRTTPVTLLLAGAAPFILLHHAINYWIGGTFAPANSVPEYLAFAGSAFDAHTLTGGWHHASVGRFLVYGADLLVGRRGFLFHNLPLLLVTPALVTLWPVRARLAEWPALVCGSAFIAASWLAYAALSTNHSGVCASIRWFVPWLAPAFYTICVCLREHPSAWRSFTGLSAWGAVVGVLLWRLGPWTFSMVPLYWFWVGAALITLIIGPWSLVRDVAKSTATRSAGL